MSTSVVKGIFCTIDISHNYTMCLRFLQVAILSRVLQEVDKIVQEFKEMLYKKMEDPHLEMSQVRACVIVLPLFLVSLSFTSRRYCCYWSRCLAGVQFLRPTREQTKVYLSAYLFCV